MVDFRGQTFVLIGISGSGKGVQGELLEKWFEQGGFSVLRVGLGEKGRELADKNSLLGGWTKEILERGDFFPNWLAFSLLVNAIDEELQNPEQVLIIDGAPRRLSEAGLIDEMFRDLSRSLPRAIYLEVTEDEARQRLVKRGRADDQSSEAISRRFALFNQETRPVLDYYGQRVIKINGSGIIEAVHQQIKQALESKND